MVHISHNRGEEVGREPWWKYALAWASAVFGGFLIAGSLLYIYEDIFDVLSLIYLGLVFGLPGMWWLYCNRKDKQAWQEFVAAQSEHVQYAAILGPQAMQNTGVQLPARRPRHWKLVALICFFAIIGFDQFSSLALTK